MCVIVEHDMTNIKKKMTEIRRNKKKELYQNYYANCESDHEIYTVYGENTVIFWHNDAGVLRGYFYSSDREELKILFKKLPSGCIVDYLTKTKNDFLDFLEDAGLHMLHEMHRMSKANLTEEEKRKIEKNSKLAHKFFYRPENVRAATIEDMEAVYEKLYEVFDPRESHLPTKEALKEYIDNQWVSVYFENDKLMGVQVYIVDASGTFYWYQLWNGTGAEGYHSLCEYSNYTYARYLKEKKIVPANIKPSYSWIDVKNRRAEKASEFWGQKFDGLYDFVYEK